jgi:hypothetical protein
MNALDGIFTAAELMARDFSHMTAAELVKEGLCDGSCLVATGPIDGCECACRGDFHGLLADTVVNIPEQSQTQIRRVSDLKTRIPKYYLATTRHRWYTPLVHAAYQRNDGTWRAACGIGRPGDVTPVGSNNGPVRWVNGATPFSGKVCERCARRMQQHRGVIEE